ncbi:MAG TPA: ABC transporter ATP-binding protein [Terriglobales bacterium]|nr:ABC transporter ATP-binding protein [Terriglobales bacterium]
MSKKHELRAALLSGFDDFDGGSITAGDDLEVCYGSVQVLWGVSLELARGQVAGMIGANGAGKTTTLNAIVGVLRAKRGRIEFKQADIGREAPHERVKRRITLVPEGRQLWPKMTVEENLLKGAFPAEFRKRAAANLEKVYALLPRLKERRAQLAGTLSGGEQQMCAIGRGLMAEPELLMLDEPSLGLAPKAVDEIFGFIADIGKQGVTILLVAQNVNYALQISQYAYLMESGRIAMKGSSASLLGNSYIQEAYLGTA